MQTWQDLKYAARTLRRSPGFTAAAVFALALGIGANTAMFSSVNAILLNSKPLRQLKDPDRLVMVWEKNSMLAEVGFLGKRLPTCIKNYLAWKRESRSFQDLALLNQQRLTITSGPASGTAQPEQIEAAFVTSSFFSLLGHAPRIGRAFTPEEMQPGKGRVAIIADSVYRTRFHSDPRILGKTIRGDGVAYQIVGVMPEAFSLPDLWEGFQQIDAKIFLPVDLGAPEAEQVNRNYFAYGRLKPGVTLGQARSEMALIAKRLERADPQLNTGCGINIFPVASEDVSPVLRQSLLVLQAAVAFVLLIACANVANLLLTRAVGREREVAIRLALGAGRWRLIRQALTESLLLSMLGGAAGLLLAYWALDVVSVLAPEDVHGFHELRLDPLVLAFTALASVAAGVLFGLAPALRAGRSSVSQTLAQGGRTAGGSSSRLRNTLVVAEIALSIVLLIGAGLMIRTLASLMAVGPGFPVDHLFKARISLPEDRYAKPEQLVAFGDRLSERVRRLPGVTSATLAYGVPMQDATFGSYEIEGVPARPGKPRSAGFARVREGYFETLGIRLLQGRSIERRDAGAKPTPIVVSETFARLNWPNQNPIGRIVTQGDERGSVVGVASDTHQLGPDSESKPQVYVADAALRVPMVLLRTSGNPERLQAAVEKAVHEIDRDLAVYSAGTMEGVLRDWVSARRFNMTALILFASVALVLAAVGLYGVLTYTVSLRTREIGVRIALGADPRRIGRMVLGQAVVLVLIGTAIGLAASFALTRLMESAIYGVSATDPLTFTVVVLLLAGVSLVASYLPAWRAARVAPMEALRVE